MATRSGSKKARTTASPAARHVPDVIIEDIFARMPARSVLRCRGLSRAWAAALSSDAFVDRHLRLANRGGPKLCLFPDSAAAGTVHAWSRDRPASAAAAADGLTPLMDIPHCTRNGRVTPTGRPCRGLILLRSIAARLYFVCNPSAGQVTALPDGRMAGFPQPWQDYAAVGLGYDARTRTHKAVRLLYHHGEPEGCDVYDIASASSTGHWRPAAAGAKPPDLVHMNMLAVYAQGHLHWITKKGPDEATTIMSFSMAEEVFGVVPLPPEMTLRWPNMTELNGCLCLYPDRITPDQPTDIWLLTDYSTATWVLRCRIDPSKLAVFMYKKCFTPLVLTDVDGEGCRLILTSEEEHQLAEYRAASGTLLELRPAMSLSRHMAYLSQFVPYEESLVSAGRPYEDILFSSPSARALELALGRLPARTLGRLKLVCRSWRAIIETDRFAALHDAHFRETMSSAAAAAAGCHVRLLSYSPSSFSLVFVSLEPRANPTLVRNRTVCRKVCHGLVLFAGGDGATNTVHNPVTGISTDFSFRSRRPYPPKIPEVDDGRGCAGLGYDESREEHVLVSLAYTAAGHCTVRLWRLRDVRAITVTPPPPPAVRADVDLPPVHIAGKMYWMVVDQRRRLGSPRDILVFDISTLLFDTVPAPPTLPPDDAGRTILTELAGKLCVAHSCRPTETMTIWAKIGGGWETVHVIQLARWPAFSPRTTELVVPMDVDGRDGGRVLLDTGKALGYYDERSQTLETVCASLAGDDDGEFKFIVAAVCEDSLVRPYDRKCSIW